MMIDILDFEDSFTWNIACELELLGYKPKVIPFAGLMEYLEQRLLDKSSRRVLIFGPGPGHPYEYKAFKDPVLQLMNYENYFFMGICLGHQLLWSFLGAEVSRCRKPIHGDSIKLKIPPWHFFKNEDWEKSLDVQKYNSLTLKSEGLKKHLSKHLIIEGESQMGMLPRGITYQFHPESVGTSYRSAFFTGISKFLYNEGDEFANSNRRIIRPPANELTKTNVSGSSHV